MAQVARQGLPVPHERDPARCYAERKVTGPGQTAAIVGRVDLSRDRLAALEQSMAMQWRLRLIGAATTVSIAAVSA